MLKILHTADWHIGSFPAPAAKSKQNLRYMDICSYIEFLISKAKDLQPDIIIIAGDIFNQARTWSDRGLQETNTIIDYISQLADIASVCALRGTANHDGKTHYDVLTTALKNNANVTIVDEPCVKNINNLAAITFVPIFDKNQHRSEAAIPLDKEAENNYFCDKVRDAILDLKPEADAYGLPTILVTHYTVLGATMPNGQTSIFANNEVVIDPMTLIQSDYWLTCLGHIHKPQKVESSPNTFYAGSLCGLNFNDENDPHGFYMHYITDQNNISSEFIEIPSRKFHTIYLNDNQLTNIIANDYNVDGYISEPMNGDIIRVIYTCADATNKALNKALLENALYKATEAFYVQEITPAEIDIIVDKTAMNNTASIADNLRMFLQKEKDEYDNISDDQIDDCVQLAQPIIDRVLASKTVNHNIGVFTPIEIEVKNYRNYKNAVFNYNDVKFCVINGDNGAGKSSLFMDAMLDALFEETREGDITGWINNDINARSGSITFTFSIGNNIYRIIRTRQKSGKATLNLSQLSVDENGNRSWVDMSEEKLKDTQAAINRVVGMNAVTLKSCGLIMQDAYGLFLQADKNTRMDILGDILNLGVYDELALSAVDFNQICQRELTKLEAEENSIACNLKNGDEIQANLDKALLEHEEYKRKLAACNNELIAHTLVRESLTKNIDAYNRITTDIASLENKQKQLNVSLEEQNTIIASSYKIVSGEKAYLEKVNRHAVLSQKERELSEKSTMIQSLITKKTQLDTDIAAAFAEMQNTDETLAVITNNKRTLETELAQTDEIRRKAALYESTKLEIAKLENILDEIRDKETTVADISVKLTEANHQMDALTQEYNAKFTEIDNKAKLLEESGCPISERASCKFLLDAQMTIATKPTIVDEYNEKLRSILSQQAELKAEMIETEEQLSRLKKDLPDMDEKKKQLAVYEECALRVSGLTELNNTLSVYDQQINDLEKRKTEIISRYNALIAQLNTATTEATTLMSEVKDYDKIKTELVAIGDITAQGNAIAASKAMITAADKRIEEITQELKNTATDLSSKICEKNTIVIDSAGISKTETDILACQTRQNLLNQNIADNGKVIGRLEADLRQYQNDVRQLDTLRINKEKAAYMASNAGWLKKAFSRNGIPHNIVRSVIPILQTTASNILGQMSNNTMSIELKTEKMLTTKKEVATLDIIVCDTVTGDLPYLSRSGGERVKAALSIVLALAEIKSSESGTQLGFLFIDEPPFLDSNGIEAYCDALEAIQRRYSNLKIIAITHDPEMKSRFAQSIDVVKTSNGSEIYANL